MIDGRNLELVNAGMGFIPREHAIIDHPAVAKIHRGMKHPAKGERGYMSCPRHCGVDVRGHHSSDLVNGGCDTGPMAVADMMEWFEARGVGRPGYYTMAEAVAEFYGKSEDEMERFYDEMCGSMA